MQEIEKSKPKPKQQAVYLNLLNLEDFIEEVQSKNIKMIYLEKVYKKANVKYTGGYNIPHVVMYVFVTAYSFAENLILSHKREVGWQDAYFAQHDKAKWEELASKAEALYDDYKKQITTALPKIFIGKGIISLDQTQC